ncbi:cytochrome o ubiquinol oxidase subunit IV [Cohnella lubricantis]|uniref:Cytochrome o ubiquinol oxidase subunit IV n=1 Tax=Cohnella lubricantis TaxID=2163172 RepID=A0A841TFN7_9BACL|nr:cytochrome o ubiquinol oxidase subunit IV [Cohnella lubricantis]MBB6678040.1 cytochrome o ubiquinol oxidase subunit IV [Cohnella lubricantis]MBP2120016.1 cytochrome o ubiquinol oxidase operon protein cyoD [Cohnella lubricantis]
MATQGRHAHEANEGGHGSLPEYAIGFALSIILTLIPLLVVLNGWMTGMPALLVILITAVLQFAVQLLFFMHLREEKGPRYNLMALILGIVVVVTVVAGSIWIMVHNKMY